MTPPRTNAPNIGATRSNRIPGLVSVGLPTYNRPEGLRRTLSQLTSQTYKALEIIVSDNASPDDGPRLVTEEFVARDPRVRYVRQATNLGAAANFDYVLRAARGEFFMWAADDDEWAPAFVERCLANIGSAGTAVSGAVISHRPQSAFIPVAMPPVHPRNGTYLNLRMFLSTLAPGFIYGVHRRDSIEWVLSETQFDWWDCYFVARQIAEEGLAAFPDEVLLTLGIDTDAYVLKPFHPRKGRVFRYVPFMRSVGALILRSPDLTLWEKARLFNVMTDYMANAFVQYESQARRRQAILVRKASSLKRRMLRVGRKAYEIITSTLRPRHRRTSGEA